MVAAALVAVPARAANEPASAESLVSVAGFTKHYGKVEAVRGVDVEIRAGEIYGFIGPDGSGKSSLMKAIAGVLTFDAGTLTVFGIKVDSDAAAERIKDRIGFMPQGLGLNMYPDLSVEENIDFFAQLRLVPPAQLAERKQRLLGMTRLESFRGRPMKNLSGGMKQKLGLVCTLIHEPDLVILDEPTTGVDPVSRRDFWAILAELLQERGTTALVSTAYMDEASRFHRASLFFEGRVLAQGEPDDIAALVPGALVSMRAKPQPEALAKLQARFPQVEALGARLQIFVDDISHEEAQKQVESVLAGLQIDDLQVSAPELEDVFIALLRRQGLVQREGAKTASSVKPPSSTGDAIVAQDLVRDFAEFRAVDKVSFRVPSGEIFGLLGANGAGKTTVIKMLTGLLPPTGGSGRVADADMSSAGQLIKERIGYMSQAFSLYLDLSVEENIRLFAGIYGLDRPHTAERLAWIIDIAGLAGHESTPAGSLPMGLRQRLALGCALVHRPQILFLDEPTSGVDPVGRRRFWNILFRLSREDGVAILVTTHYMSEAEHCDHLALMYAGRVVADASPEQMKDAVQAEAGRLMEILADQPQRALDVLGKAGIEGGALFGKRIHLLTPDTDGLKVRIETAFEPAGLKLLELSERPLSMEDVFVYRVLQLERRDKPV